MIVVRELLESDWEIYREIRLTSLQESPDAFGSTWLRESALEESHWRSRVSPLPGRLPLGAFDDRQLLGIACGVCSTAEPGRADVYQMFVEPAVRGRGISRLLMERLLRWFKQQQIERVYLVVSEGNLAAEKLYLSMGFQPVGQPVPLREGSDVMSREMLLEIA